MRKLMHRIAHPLHHLERALHFFHHAKGLHDPNHFLVALVGFTVLHAI